jgi:hypothetical protein
MRIEIKSVAVGLAALVWIPLIAGCPGSLRDPGRFADAGTTGGGADAGSNCPEAPKEILAMKCGGVGCHGATAPAQGLDLVSDGVAARVVGVKATECMGTLADPASPATSVLYTKLTAAPPCGGRMPVGGMLPDDEIACVKEWIAAQTPSGATSTGAGGATSTGTGAGGAGGGG